MRRSRKVMLIILIFLVCIFIITSILVGLFGKNIAEEQVSAKLKMPARIKSIGLRLPFTVVINGLDIPPLASAERISFSPNIFGFLAGKIVISGLTITRPVLNLERSSDGKFNLPVMDSGGKQPQVFVTSLSIDQGRVVFMDKQVAANGYPVILDGLNVRIAKNMFPLESLRISLNLSGRFVDCSDKVRGNVAGSGWVDFNQKDMDSILAVKDADALYFMPYYGSMLNKRLESGLFNFSTKLKAKNNDLKILCHFKLSKLVFVKDEPQAEGVSQMDILPALANIFTNNQGDIEFDFNFSTKLDQFRINNAALGKAFSEGASRNLASQSPDQIAGKVSAAIDNFKAFGKEMKDYFKKNKEN